MLNVEVFYFDGCPGHEPTFALLQSVLAEERTQAKIVRIEVPGPDAVEEYRFMGSPSIRVDGVDLEGSEAEEELGYGWRCRCYADSEPGQKCVPASSLIRRRLRERTRNGGR